MVRLRELHVAEDVELTQTLASEEEKEQPTGFGAPAAAQQSDDSGCGSFYSFEMSVTMSPPSRRRPRRPRRRCRRGSEVGDEHDRRATRRS